MSRLEDSTISLLKQYSPDLYNSVLFAPAGKRDALFALYAFAMELDRIPDSVTEPALGEIKLQWWRDTLEQSRKGQQSGNPLADVLGSVINNYNLPAVRVIEMVDARSFELSDDIFPDQIDLKIYLKKTYISMFTLASMILDEGHAGQQGNICEDAGLAYGYSMMLCKLPVHISKGRIYLPQSIIDRHDIDIDNLLHGKETDQLRNALDELGGLAVKHYNKFKDIEPQISSNFSPAFLPVTLVNSYVSFYTDKKHRILRELIRINPLYRLWKYWRAAAFGAF